MQIIFKKRQAFIFPILVGVMAIAMTITSVLMTSVVSKLASYGKGSLCSLRANYAASAAIDSLAHDTQFPILATSSACTSGTYVVPNSGTCALPGAVGTVATMDSSCTYSAQLITKTTGTININAIGRCTIDECRGSSGAVVEINTDVNDKRCIASCPTGCAAGNIPDGCGGTCGCFAPTPNCNVDIYGYGTCGP